MRASWGCLFCKLQPVCEGANGCLAFGDLDFDTMIQRLLKQGAGEFSAGLFVASCSAAQVEGSGVELSGMQDMIVYVYIYIYTYMVFTTTRPQAGRQAGKQAGTQASRQASKRNAHD